MQNWMFWKNSIYIYNSTLYTFTTGLNQLSSRPEKLGGWLKWHHQSYIWYIWYTWTLPFFIISTPAIIFIQMLTAVSNKVNPAEKQTFCTKPQYRQWGQFSVSVSSLPFPLAAGGQAGIFGGVFPAVICPCLLIHVFQNNHVTWMSCVCTFVYLLFMVWEMMLWVGWDWL